MYGSVRGAARKGRPYRDRGIRGAETRPRSGKPNDPRGKPKAPG
jgi:hypothetical protein